MADRGTSLLIWIDAQLPPLIAQWVKEPGKVQSVHICDLGLLTASDAEIFERARSAGAVVVTKDQDFIQLQAHRGAPPKIVWLTCGNLGNRELRRVFSSCWPRTLALLQAGENLVEIKASRPVA
ncbi:MAG: DUF5615 family PIN-like protein [Candidatus Binatia bacterium]